MMEEEEEEEMEIKKNDEDWVPAGERSSGDAELLPSSCFLARCTSHKGHSRCVGDFATEHKSTETPLKSLPHIRKRGLGAGRRNKVETKKKTDHTTRGMICHFNFLTG